MPSDAAELSALRAQLGELTERLVAVADRYRSSPDSALLADLDAVERQLLQAARALDRALRSLA